MDKQICLNTAKEGISNHSHFSAVEDNYGEKICNSVLLEAMKMIYSKPVQTIHP